VGVCGLSSWSDPDCRNTQGCARPVYGVDEMIDFLGMCVTIFMLIALIVSLIALFVTGYILVLEDKANGKDLPG
jgi:hypothetical protein